MQAKFKCRICRGFTYIEMTIAILIMGIIAAVSAPSYVSVLQNHRVDMAARKIVADLHYARAEAQRNSQSRAVQFEPSNDRYTLHNVADLDHSGSAYVVDLVDDPYLTTLVSATFGVDAVVVFNMYGRPDDGGTVTVQSGSVQKTVTLATDGTATSP